ncbi:hypothetical protein G159_02100 [Planococcus glaciei CHR43]|uniref:DUF4126 domain-containing protein n=1 Tax=Planococcus glaciei TaxID=459472 RepID=UPI0003DF1CD5|nr:DUF4126 domain-containing protein [Planococcus glaciei]ETP70343.1 hypothetical protein G159_02100 [Planococcus glaciei CHR43]
MEMILAICIGLALSATVGFRIFTPLFITGVFERVDWITVTEGFSWLGSTPALVAFGAATIFEIAVNYIPAVGSIMKVIATPIAAIAGILLTASFIGDMNPLLEWSIAIIGGGGIAAASHAAVTGVKGVSETALLSPAVAVVEDITATTVPIAIFLVPVLAIVFVVLIPVLIFTLYNKRKRRKKNRNPVERF